MMKRRRRAFSMLELTISLASAAILTISLGSSLVVASRGLDLINAPEGRRTDASRVARELARDLQQATRFTEQTATATTFLVPDRDADGKPESIRYAWSGTAGAPLTMSLNGATPVDFAANVQSLNLAYSSQAMTAPTAPTESAATGVKLLYITAGTAVQTSGVSASQRVATAPTLLVNPSSLDRKKIELFESWGYDVTFILPNEPWANLSALIDQTQLIFVSAEADGDLIQSNIYDSNKGIVVERAYQHDDARLASNSSGFTDTGIRVRSPSHYTMSGYTNGQFVSILSSNSDFYYFSGLGSGVTNVMGPSGRSEPSMMSISPGSRLNNGSFAPGRRILIPWGFPGFNYDRLTTDGRTILRRCLEWAGGAGSDPNSLEQTFGNTSVYMNLFTPGAGRQIATKVNLAQAGKIQSISAFAGGGVGTIRFAIYSHHGPQNRPNTLLAQSGIGLTLSGGNRWITLNLPETNLSAGDYWLAINFGLTSQTVNMTPGGEYVTLNYDATLLGFKNSWGSPDSNEPMKLSIYGTYKPN